MFLLLEFQSVFLPEILSRVGVSAGARVGGYESQSGKVICFLIKLIKFSFYCLMKPEIFWDYLAQHAPLIYLFNILFFLWQHCDLQYC